MCDAKDKALRTPALVKETIEDLTTMAAICRRADLVNVAAKMEELAAKWKRSMWFDGSPAIPRPDHPRKK